VRFKTFEAGILGGTLFRLGVGATAFLLPLMLQLGFGLDALRSGLITFAGAIGALAMKPLAHGLLRRFGFRRLLIVNGLAASCLIVANAGWTATTPHLLISLVLLIGGFSRSLQFTSLSAITYAELDSKQIAAATSMSTVAQQVSISLGVAIGAMVLEMSEWFSGRHDPVTADFAAAFLVVGALSSLTVLAMLRLPAGAGDEITGRAVIDAADPSPGRHPGPA
jgi:Na+/melibiose symporter-like transporter